MKEFATIRDSAQSIRQAFREATGGYHAEVYVRVLGDQNAVQYLAQTGAQQVMSYGTFDGFSHVEGDAEAVISLGYDSDTRGFLDYLGIAEGSDTMELTFMGEESDGDHPRLASHWRANGALEATVRTPASQDDLQKVPWGLTDRWTGDLQYVARAGLDDEGKPVDNADQYTPPTSIETTASAVRESIIEVSDFLDVPYFPVIVRDGELVVDVSDNDGDNSINGTVNTESVEGPDVERYFEQGFQELFKELNGPVTISTAPGGGGGPEPPLVVTQNHRSDRTLRHVLGPFSDKGV